MSGREAIPFLELVAMHREMAPELTEVFKRALESAVFVGGPMVAEFESAFADFCGTKHCIGVGSGTDALRFALIAAGVKSGDLVITVPNTFIATVEAISQAGAEPRFVDIDERTYNIDPAKIIEYLENSCTFDHGVLTERKTGKPVTAIVPVHLYGQMADMDAILEIAEQYKLIVIEDACQAHGAQYFSRKENLWRPAGSIGRAAAFSFYPGKNLGACGEAGAITTNDEVLANYIRMLRDHGQSTKYYHEMEGYNGRLDSIQAGLLHAKLRYLPEWNAKRRERAAEYNRLLACAAAFITLPYEPSWSRAVYHLYAVRTEDRDGLIAHLKSAGIGTGIHYPIPLHLQKAYRSLGYMSGDFPVCENAATQIISLPMFPQLTLEQQARVADEMMSFIQKAFAISRLSSS